MSGLMRVLASLKRAVESYLGRFLLFAASLLLIIFLIDVHDAGDFPDWLLDGDGGDSFPAWIAALATVGAFIAAFVAVRHSWALLRLERTRRAEAEQAAERAVQADGIAAWMTPSGETHVRNSSDLPVYDVAVAWVDGADQRGIELGTWPPDHEQTVQFPFTAGVRNGLTGEIGHYEDPRRYRVLVRFRDTAGRTWQRDQFGVLAPPTWTVPVAPAADSTLSVSEIVANWRTEVAGSD
jgi:hypothetical protein